MQYRPFMFVTTAICATAIMAGCSKPDPKEVATGNWRIRPESIAAQSHKLAVGPDGNPLPPQEAKKVGEFYGSIRLDMRPDQTFTLTMGMALEGTWELSGNTVTLTPTKIAGQPIPVAPGSAGQAKMTGQLDAEKARLEITPMGAGAGGGVTLLSFEKIKE